MGTAATKPCLLVTTSTLPRFLGDPEPRFVLDLSKQLSKSFDVTVLAPADPQAALVERMEGLRVVRYRYAPLRAMEVIAYPGAIIDQLKQRPILWPLVPLLIDGLRRAVGRLLSTQDFDCVQAHWLIPQGAIQGLCFAGADAPPYIITCLGADVYTNNGILGRRIKQRALRNAAAITVVSKALQGELTRQFGAENVSDKCHVAPMGVDLDLFRPDKRSAAWVDRHKLRRPVIIFVGRLAEKKGLKYLLQALAQEPLKMTDATLAVIGDGPMRGTLEALSQDLGIGHRVRFLGGTDHASLCVAFASADIFCGPFVTAANGDQEGLPTVLCEAAASGLPAVATRVGGVAEILVDKRTGLLVAERDVDALSHALYRLVRDDQLRREMGRAAREHVVAFGWERIGAIYAKVISDAIQARTAETGGHDCVGLDRLA